MQEQYGCTGSGNAGWRDAGGGQASDVDAPTSANALSHDYDKSSNCLLSLVNPFLDKVKNYESQITEKLLEWYSYCFYFSIYM